MLLSLALASVSAAALFVRVPHPHARGRGIHKIKHVVIVMQENRSFDSYFGTYPGADGIPRTSAFPTR